MNAVANILNRVADRASIATLLLSLFACAGQPTESSTTSTAAGAIGVENAEQVPIQEQSARERAAENARNCRSPAGARIECDADGMGRMLDQVSRPTGDTRFE